MQWGLSPSSGHNLCTSTHCKNKGHSSAKTQTRSFPSAKARENRIWIKYEPAMTDSQGLNRKHISIHSNCMNRIMLIFYLRLMRKPVFQISVCSDSASCTLSQHYLLRGLELIFPHQYKSINRTAVRALQVPNGFLEISLIHQLLSISHSNQLAAFAWKGNPKIHTFQRK